MPQKIIPVDTRAKQKFDAALVCENCKRPQAACFCTTIAPGHNRLRVVILQHPQEQYKALNSARLTHLLLKNSALFVGLSWPNFKKVAGPDAMPSQWGVLYLAPEAVKSGKPLIAVDRRKQPLEDLSFLKGIVALDGSWKQAKSLWWRNAWLLKLNRISLNSNDPSLRPQVNAAGLSTAEAVAFALEHLRENAGIPALLRDHYRRLIIEPKP